jgi:hypothetical protein
MAVIVFRKACLYSTVNTIPENKNVPILHTHSFLSLDVLYDLEIILDPDLKRFYCGSGSDLLKKLNVL